MSDYKTRFAIGVVFSLLCLAPSVRADNCASAARDLYEVSKEDLSTETAEKKLRNIIAACPELAQGHFNLGLSLSAQGKNEAAVQSFKKATEIKKELLSLVALGNALVKLGRDSEAQTAYQDALKLDSSSFKALQGLGVLHLKARRYAEAEDSFRKSIQISPDDAAGFYNLGLLLAEQGRIDEAKESFKAAAERKAPYPEASLQLAALYLRERKADDAEAELRAVSLHQPRNPDVWLGLAQVAELKEDYALAISNLDKALAIDPAYLRVKINRAVVKVKSGDKEGGISELKALAAAEPKDAAVQGALGWALMQSKDYAGAEAALQAALGANAQDYYALNNLGVLYELKGDKERAAKALEQARLLRPNLEIAKGNLEELAR